MSRMQTGTPPSRTSARKRSRRRTFRSWLAEVTTRPRSTFAAMTSMSTPSVRRRTPRRDSTWRTAPSGVDADPVADHRRSPACFSAARDGRQARPVRVADGDAPAVDGGHAGRRQAGVHFVGHPVGPAEGVQLRVQRSSPGSVRLRGRWSSLGRARWARGDLLPAARRRGRAGSAEGDQGSCAGHAHDRKGATPRTPRPVACAASTVDGMSGVRETAILTEGLRKSYGSVLALDGVDLSVAQGTVFGLLGPNGAGKTTCVRILTTLLVPDGGRAEVGGLDVVRDATLLRARIGLAGQYAAIDENLTGFENLEMVGRLYHLSRTGVDRAGARAARALRALRRRRPPREDLLGRHAPPPGPRGRARRAPADPLPRRADDGPRSPLAPRHVGHDHRARGGGDDGPAHHAVPRGGRPPRRPHRGHRSRPRDRRGHVGRAQGALRRRADRGRPRRDRRPAGRHRGARAHDRRAGGAGVRGADGQAAGARPRGRPGGGRAAARRGRRGARGPRGAPADARRRVPLADRPRRRGRRSPRTRRPGRRRADGGREHPRGPAARRGRRLRRQAALGPAGHDGDREAQPAPRPAQPRAAARIHHPAGHVRAAVPLRLRRRDQHAGRVRTSTS